jgi:hypothetical protein
MRIVDAERSRLNQQYTQLRARILGVLGLTGFIQPRRRSHAQPHQLPPKLGHWQPRHSQAVRSACPELVNVVTAIEVLLARRDAALIKAHRPRRKPGGRRRPRSTHEH